MAQDLGPVAFAADAFALEYPGPFLKVYQKKYSICRSAFFLARAARGLKSAAQQGRPAAARKHNLKTKACVESAAKKKKIGRNTAVKYRLLRCLAGTLTPRQNARRLKVLFGFASASTEKLLTIFLPAYLLLREFRRLGIDPLEGGLKIRGGLYLCGRIKAPPLLEANANLIRICQIYFHCCRVAL